MAQFPPAEVDVARFAIALNRRALAAYALSLAVLGWGILLFYPAVRRAAAAVEHLLAGYPQALLAVVGLTGPAEIGSPGGYLEAELFSLVVPAILLVEAIGLGAWLAREEAAGRLDMVLAAPVSRSSVYRGYGEALTGGLLLSGLGLWAGLVAGAVQTGMEVGAGRLLEATGLAVLLALLFGALALALAGATGRPGIASGIPAALAVVAYLWNGLAPLIPALRALEPWSPFYQAEAMRPLTGIPAAGHALLLFAAVLVVSGIGYAAFARRDIGV